MSIPRIDLMQFKQGSANDRIHFVETLGQSLQSFGFFKLTGHGLNKSLVAETYLAHERFFALDEGLKIPYDRAKGGQRGYTPFGREKAKDSQEPDLKEFFHVGQELASNDPYFDVYGHNIWPDEVPEMKALSNQLFAAMEAIASDLLIALAIYFDIDEGVFANMMVNGNHVLRSIHYPPITDHHNTNAIRAAAHEDINLITLLIESKGQGLELLTADGNWLPIDALEGDIVVDSGDMLSRVCNGEVPSTTHRVVNPPGHANVSRYSMPFFVHPFPSCDLTVLDRFVSAEKPAQFPPTTAHAFLTERLKQIGLIS